MLLCFHKWPSLYAIAAAYCTTNGAARDAQSVLCDAQCIVRDAEILGGLKQ